MLTSLLMGAALGAVCGWVGHRIGRLSAGGALVACAATALVFGVADWTWGLVLALYFLGAGGVARYQRQVKQRISSAQFLEGTSQGWRQVLARVGWAVLLALLGRLLADSRGMYAAYVGAVATASADLWASEFGILSAAPPRLISTGRAVRPGAAGGVTLLGTVAAIGAAWQSGFVALLLLMIKANVDRVTLMSGWLWLPLGALLGGLTGCLTDSLLGATAQGMYYCERCEERTERPVHTCGGRATQIRGWAWLSNDGVDLASTVVGAGVAAGLLTWLARFYIGW